MKTTKIQSVYAMDGIKIIPAYKIVFRRQDGSKVTRLFPSLRAAASKLAWWTIFDRYHERVIFDEHQTISGEDHVSNITHWCIRENSHLYDACTCLDMDGISETTTGYPCPVHDKQSGYLRRLHDRITPMIERKLIEAK